MQIGSVLNITGQAIVESAQLLRIAQLVLLNVAIPLAVVLLIHFKIGKYPDPVPLSKNRTRAILESVGVSIAASVVLTVFLFSLSPSDLANPGPGVMGKRILLGMPFELIVPLLYLLLAKK